MRILHILDHSLPLQSGYAFRTSEILREQSALGWATLQLTTPRQQAGADVETIDGIAYHRTPFQSTRADRVPGVGYVREMAATARRLGELVGEFRPDMLHAHSPVLNALPAIRVARRVGLPVVYEVRALWEDAAVDHGRTLEGSLRYRASRALETHALHRVDHVTTICEGLRGEIVARGVSEAGVTVIPNAVDTTAFRFGASADPALRRRLGLEGRTVIGFAGSFYGYEGLDLLIDALARLVESRRDLRVLLVGGGPQEQVLRAQVAAQGLEGRVVMTGRVPHNEVARYYELIDVLAYPRHRMRLTELVTPLKPLEAMAQGRILVASDVGGHREMIRDGETGFLFAAGDAGALAASIERALAARADWPRLAAAGRQYVERERTWKASVARYAAVYDGLVARAGARAAAHA